MPSRIKARPPRKRAFTPKTRTGCKTCRIRRIKCDENRPSCGQCTRGRRICDGYVNPASPSQTHRRFESLSASFTTMSVCTLIGTDQERRCFHYFRCRTVPQLSGSFESTFWNRLLLQATQHQPVVWHAVVALGSLHRHFEQRHQNLSEADEFALQQYVKAIGLVLKPIREQGHQAADVVLISCVLFVCFEILRGYHSAALSHINGGVKIISELPSCQPNTTLSLAANPYVPLPVFKQIFSRLDAQASQISNRRPRHLLYQNLSTTNPSYNADIPTSFQSFEAARNELDYIHTDAMIAMQSLPPPSPITYPPSPIDAQIKLSLDLICNSSTIRLKKWSSAFESLLQTQKDNLSEFNQREVDILKLHRVLMSINLNIDLVRAKNDEMMWDNYTEEFETMVRYAEDLLNSTATQEQSAFTLDTEVILPLYFVAVKCRHGRVRRKAISLLRSQQRQEGVWNSFLTARVAERSMQIEEEGLDSTIVVAAEVLRFKRVLGVEVSFDFEHRRANLEFVKLKENGGVDRVNEWIEWTSLGPKIL
ncbi:hypothetical protein B7463_g10185, partial [Scytalidium lignicola]